MTEHDWKTEVRVRRERVRYRGLTSCELCGGTTDAVEDGSLECVCALRRSQLEARITRLAHNARNRDIDGISDRLAP